MLLNLSAYKSFRKSPLGYLLDKYHYIKITENSKTIEVRGDYGLGKLIYLPKPSNLDVRTLINSLYTLEGSDVNLLKRRHKNIWTSELEFGNIFISINNEGCKSVMFYTLYDLQDIKDLLRRSGVYWRCLYQTDDKFNYDASLSEVI